MIFFPLQNDSKYYTPSQPFRCQVFLWKAKSNVCTFFWQTFIESLSNSHRERLLLDVLCNGRGSLDYAKQLVANSEDPNPDTPAKTNCPNWCICNVCMDMGNEEENKCCVTSYELFRNIVLGRELLTIAIRARCDIRAENAGYEMNSFRKAAYRQFILWKYGKLGKRNRRVCPSCVVRLVRQTYPALDGQYMGFSCIIINIKTKLRIIENDTNGTLPGNYFIMIDYGQKPIRVETCNGPLCAGKQASEYSIC